MRTILYWIVIWSEVHVDPSFLWCHVYASLFKLQVSVGPLVWRWYVTSHFELHGFHLCYPSNIRTYESPTKPTRIRYLAIRLMNLRHKKIVISQKVRYAVWHQYLYCLTLRSHFAPEALWTHFLFAERRFRNRHRRPLFCCTEQCDELILHWLSIQQVERDCGGRVLTYDDSATELGY